MQLKSTHSEIVTRSKTNFPKALWLDWSHIHDNNPDFKAADREGWLITITGCLIPIQESVNTTDLKNFRKAFGFREIPIVDTEPFPQDWPSRYQHSSLCHDHLCCNPFHFVFEHQWKNIRRNFCRGMIFGHHDCNMYPPCLSVYRKTHLSRKLYECLDGQILHKEIEEISLGNKFPEFCGLYNPSERYKKEFEKATKRAERRRNLSADK